MKSALLVCSLLILFTSCGDGRSDGGFTIVHFTVAKEWAQRRVDFWHRGTIAFDGSVEVYDLAWGDSPESKPVKILTDDVPTEVYLKRKSPLRVRLTRRGDHEGSVIVSLPIVEGKKCYVDLAADGRILVNGEAIE